jgi:hypothetical protein
VATPVATLVAAGDPVGSSFGSSSFVQAARSSAPPKIRTAASKPRIASLTSP